MRKSMALFFIMSAIFFIAIFQYYPLKAPLAEDQVKKNPSADKKADTTLVWYRYDEGLAKAEKEKKHVLVSFYTTWCGWCRKMEQFTYKDKDIIKALNENYVPIKVNAQSKDMVIMEKKKVTETEVARKFSVRSYPTTWFLKDSGERIAPYYGFADAQSFVIVLNYIKDDLYDKISFNEYVKSQDKEEGSGKGK